MNAKNIHPTESPSAWMSKAYNRHGTRTQLYNVYNGLRTAIICILIAFSTIHIFNKTDGMFIDFFYLILVCALFIHTNLPSPSGQLIFLRAMDKERESSEESESSDDKFYRMSK